MEGLYFMLTCMVENNYFTWRCTLKVRTQIAVHGIVTNIWPQPKIAATPEAERAEAAAAAATEPTPKSSTPTLPTPPPPQTCIIQMGYVLRGAYISRYLLACSTKSRIVAINPRVDFPAMRGLCCISDWLLRFTSARHRPRRHLPYQWTLRRSHAICLKSASSHASLR